MSRYEIAVTVAVIALLAGSILCVAYTAVREARVATILDCYDRANTPMQLAVCRGIDRDVRFTW